MKPLRILSVPVLLLAFGTTISSCWTRVCDGCGDDVVRKEAYVPVYGHDSAKYLIKSMPVKSIARAGKIYVWGNLLFQVDEYTGVHVINYSDKQNPVKLGFISIRGCSEIAVKGNYLIANNMNDLVTIDFSQPADVKEVSRLKGAFPSYMYNFYYAQPDEKNVYYKCPNEAQGDVIGWKLEKDVKGAWCHN